MADTASLKAEADRLAEAGRLVEAEAAYRAALQADTLFAPAALGLAHLLMWQGRPDDAADAGAALAAHPAAPLPVIEMQVRALVAAGRLEEALPLSRRAAAAGSPHAALGSAQIAANLGRFAEAEAAFRAVLAREPGDERARRGLARALFAGPAGADGALQAIDEGLTHRWSPALAGFKASVLGQADRPAEALAAAQAALRRAPSPDLHAAVAAAAALDGQAELALAHAEAALRLAPTEQALVALVAETRLGVGDAQGALALIEPLRRAAPLDQKRIAHQATAWRMLGDDRAHALYDYDRYVRTYALEAPAGWTTLHGFLGDLAKTLHTIHDGQGATLDQSVRGGSQTNVDLTRTRDPVLRALFAALAAPIRDHVARLGRGGDLLSRPLEARNTGRFAFGGAWSVRLKPGAGRHVNHTHPQGWLSSAFYVDLPDAVTKEGEEGWIQFGEPGCPTRPHLGPEHKVRPEPGRLVLFPSYMWHGTRPFGGSQTRLTFAFDVVPAGQS
ncbi:MAG TPA: 2OG-Fe(II) oxygenase family protein [Caulobacteraceae bacterium]|jgi:tetratricopeptide (TPR) repeat protein